MRRISALFKDDTEIATLSGHASSVSALQKTWHASIPEMLKPFTQACAIKHKRLTVHANNGIVAAKLKLLLPSLLIKLQKQGIEVTSIRVEVQVQSGTRKQVKPARLLSPAAASSLGALADELVGSELGDALARLAGRT